MNEHVNECIDNTQRTEKRKKKKISLVSFIESNNSSVDNPFSNDMKKPFIFPSAPPAPAVTLDNYDDEALPYDEGLLEKYYVRTIEVPPIEGEAGKKSVFMTDGEVMTVEHLVGVQYFYCLFFTACF